MIWKITYVGSAESNAYDQVLEEVAVGPIVVGTYEFILEASAPDAETIPASDLVGITVVLVTCSYMGQNPEPKEFIRVGAKTHHQLSAPPRDARTQLTFAPHILFAGYYVNIEYEDQELRDNPPARPLAHLHNLSRHVVDDQPRVTKFHVLFDEPEMMPQEDVHDDDMMEEQLETITS